ncbi:MAG: hypothetical protein CVV27_12230 [Candidatus Melainabacteria bacterium HGW-Melainabacteria-1]|nr:MAG: hypothetical protein CVV27_12230 [Candidatus Melainabacteria bacterium HGW-Melainabacteria-1]
MGNMSLNTVRQMVSSALNDSFSPGKVDKYEVIDIQAKLTDKGAEPDQAVRAFLTDQIALGKFEQGAAALLQDFFNQNKQQSFGHKVEQQANLALNTLHKAVDFGWVGKIRDDQTVLGSENAEDVAKMAEHHLIGLQKLGHESGSLARVLTATLAAGKAIQDPEKRLNSYLTALVQIRAEFADNHESRVLARDAIQTIHSAVRTSGSTLLADGRVQGHVPQAVYLVARSHLEQISRVSHSDIISHQALSGLTASREAVPTSYQAATNVILQTLVNIASEN